MHEQIYLLIEREFILLDENVYKVGRSSQTGMKRFNQYPKGSQLLLFVPCINSVDIEKIIIALFRKKYISRFDIGHEYFECDNYTLMLLDIINIIHNHSSIINFEKNKTYLKEQKNKYRILDHNLDSVTITEENDIESSTEDEINDDNTGYNDLIIDNQNQSQDDNTKQDNQMIDNGDIDNDNTDATPENEQKNKKRINKKFTWRNDKYNNHTVISKLTKTNHIYLCYWIIDYFNKKQLIDAPSNYLRKQFIDYILTQDVTVNTYFISEQNFDNILININNLISFNICSIVKETKRIIIKWNNENIDKYLIRDVNSNPVETLIENDLKNPEENKKQIKRLLNLFLKDIHLKCVKVNDKYTIDERYSIATIIYEKYLMFTNKKVFYSKFRDFCKINYYNFEHIGIINFSKLLCNNVIKIQRVQDLRAILIDLDILPDYLKNS